MSRSSQLRADGLRELPFGNSDRPEIGEHALVDQMLEFGDIRPA
jgi:hypothetical protein